jgi:hypothetical protein
VDLQLFLKKNPGFAYRYLLVHLPRWEAWWDSSVAGFYLLLYGLFATCVFVPRDQHRLLLSELWQRYNLRLPRFLLKSVGEWFLFYICWIWRAQIILDPCLMTWSDSFQWHLACLWLSFSWKTELTLGCSFVHGNSRPVSKIPCKCIRESAVSVILLYLQHQGTQTPASGSIGY